MVFVQDVAALAQAQGGAQGGLMQMLIMIVPLFAIMYFLMIRPQQKKQKEHDAMLKGVKAGDNVMTNSGIFGKVVKVTERRVVIEIAERVNVEFLLDAVVQVIADDKPEEAAK